MTDISQKLPSSIPFLVLFTRDYKARLHVSNIAKTLNLSQKTTSRKLESLQKLSLLKFNKVGKNKYYSFNYTLRTAFSLLEMVENYKEIKFSLHHPEMYLLLNEISQDYELILFGSYAKGRAKKGSDLDLVIFSSKSKKLLEIIKKYPFEVNAHYVSHQLFAKRLQEKQHLAQEIAKDHILFGSKEKIIRMFMDYFVK